MKSLLAALMLMSMSTAWAAGGVVLPKGFAATENGLFAACVIGQAVMAIDADSKVEPDAAVDQGIAICTPSHNFEVTEDENEAIQDYMFHAVTAISEGVYGQ